MIKLNSEKIGGVLLIIGGLFYMMNVYTTYIDGDIKGVNILWAIYFCALNIIYTYIFFEKKMLWSTIGSGILSLAELSWLFQIIYYKFIL